MPDAPAEPLVVVVPDADALAAYAAARLLVRLADGQALTGGASVGLTGGGIGIAVLEQAAASPARAAVDWRRLDVWWGDERFVAADDDERNELQARRALLDAVDLDPGRVRPMPPSDGSDGDDPDAAAARYADLVGQAGAPDRAWLDVLLLGVGDDGHTASLFPGFPQVEDTRLAVAVRDAAKPPPTRVSLGLRAINAASEVWFVVSGRDKAPVVARALSGAPDATALPPSAVSGRDATLWLLDEDAAAELPAGLRRR